MYQRTYGDLYADLHLISEMLTLNAHITIGEL